MPILPLPLSGTTLAGGDLPVSDGSDILKELPDDVRRPEVAAIRDAFCDAFAEGFVEYQSRVELAAAQVDPLRATGIYLRDIAEQRGVVPFPGEAEASIRARLFAAPEIITPNAIYDRVNAIIAPYTPKTCSVFEPDLDGMFVCDGTADFGFIGGTFNGVVGIGSDPIHLDRLYPDDAIANGVFIPGSGPGYAIPSKGYPRDFVVRIPALEDADNNFAFISDVDEGAFFTDGTEVADYDPAFIFVDTLSADELYSTIVSTVETIKGQGISWTLYVDPAL